MVVGHDHVDCLPGCIINLRRITDPAIAGNDEFCALFGQVIDSRSIETVSFFVPMRYVTNDLRREQRKRRLQYCRTTDTIGIVIAVNGNKLALLSCIINSGAGLLHILKKKRIRKLTELRIQKIINQFLTCKTSTVQKSLDNARILGEIPNKIRRRSWRRDNFHALLLSTQRSPRSVECARRRFG